MSLSSFLLTKENLERVQKKSWKFGRSEVIALGMRYYDEHAEEVAEISRNLAFMGMESSGSALGAVLEHIVAHYYEKLFAMVKRYEAYWIAKNRIEIGDGLEPFVEARETGKAVFVGQSHFGATYLKSAVLTAHGFDVNVVGNFPEPVGSMLIETSDEMTKRYSAGRVNLVNIANPDVDVPMEMFRLLATGKIVSNVFDENNPFCKPVQLLGKKIMGGTGMDLILRNYSDEKVIVVTPFLVRTSEDTFRYELDRHELKDGNIVQSFFNSLEKRIKKYPEQWYFIHEVHQSFIEE